MVTTSTPSSMARGKVRPGSRTSPAILLTSHQPPKEKNPPTMAAPSAGPKGTEPGRCATKGTKFDHDPRRNAKAQTTIDASRPSFSQVVQRKIPAPMRMLNTFSKQRDQITPTATSLATRAEQGKMYAA